MLLFTKDFFVNMLILSKNEWKRMWVSTFINLVENICMICSRQTSSKFRKFFRTKSTNTFLLARSPYHISLISQMNVINYNQIS